MAWTFNNQIDVVTVNGQVRVRVRITSGSGEVRCENLWFSSVPNAAAKTAAITRLIAGLQASELDNANRQQIASRIDNALAAGIAPAVILNKLQNAIDGI